MFERMRSVRKLLCYCCGRSEGELSSQFARSLSCCFRKERSAKGIGGGYVNNTRTQTLPRTPPWKFEFVMKEIVKLRNSAIGAKLRQRGPAVVRQANTKSLGGPFTEKECQGMGLLADHVMESSSLYVV